TTSAQSILRDSFPAAPRAIAARRLGPTQRMGCAIGPPAAGAALLAEAPAPALPSREAPMFDSSKYQVDPALAEAFVAEQRHGTLLATLPDGHPQASLLSFLKSGDLIEL